MPIEIVCDMLEHFAQPFFWTSCRWANFVNCWEGAWTGQQDSSPRKSLAARMQRHNASHMSKGYSRRSQHHTAFIAELPQFVAELEFDQGHKVFLFIELSRTLLLCRSTANSVDAVLKDIQQLQITLAQNYCSWSLPKSPQGRRVFDPSSHGNDALSKRFGGDQRSFRSDPAHCYPSCHIATCFLSCQMITPSPNLAPAKKTECATWMELHLILRLPRKVTVELH